MEAKKYFLTAMICMMSYLLSAGSLPLDQDSWSEYATGMAAESDGWTRTCGLSQQIVSSSDHIAGTYSVGCRAISSQWTKTFHFVKSVSLWRVMALRFFHKDSWDDRNVNVRIYMTPTAEEQAEGIIDKWVAFDYVTSTEWTEFVGSFDSGEWHWNNPEGSSEAGNTQLTELIKIEWFAYYYFPWLAPVSIGDQMLMDHVHFVTMDVDLVDLNDLAAVSRWYGRTDCNPANIYCEYADRYRDGVVDINDLMSLANHWLEEDLS